MAIVLPWICTPLFHKHFSDTVTAAKMIKVGFIGTEKIVNFQTKESLYNFQQKTLFV